MVLFYLHNLLCFLTFQHCLFPQPKILLGFTFEFVNVKWMVQTRLIWEVNGQRWFRIKKLELIRYNKCIHFKLFLYFQVSVCRLVFTVTPMVGFWKMWAPGLVPVKVSYTSILMKSVLFRPPLSSFSIFIFLNFTFSPPHSNHIYWHEWKQFNKSIGRGLCFPLFKFYKYNNLLWIRRNFKWFYKLFTIIWLSLF